MDDIEEIVRKIAGQGKDKVKQSENYVQLVVFELDSQEYAVEIESLLEIIKTPLITPIPGTGDSVKGIFNLRGKIIVAVDLLKCFKLTRTVEEKALNIIIVEAESDAFGVLVDRVSEIIKVAESTIKQFEAVTETGISSTFIKGRINVHSSRLIILLDLQKILLEQELVLFG